jgi:hypothetical protein
MFWIYARPIVAVMADKNTFGNRTTIKLIRNPMRELGPSVYGYLSVPGSILARGPIPAAASSINANVL